MSLWSANVIETSQSLKSYCFSMFERLERLDSTALIDQIRLAFIPPLLTEELLVSLWTNVLLLICTNLLYTHPNCSAVRVKEDESLEEYIKN